MRAPRNRKPLSEDERLQIVMSAREGKTLTDLMAMYKRSFETVKRIVNDVPFSDRVETGAVSVQVPRNNANKVARVNRALRYAESDNPFAPLAEKFRDALQARGANILSFSMNVVTGDVEVVQRIRFTVG